MKKFYFLFILFIGGNLFAQTTYEYYFNNSLNEATTGPTLVDTLTCSASAAGYGSQAFCSGAAKPVLDFSAGEGLVFRNDPSFIGRFSSFTINMFMKYNTLTGTGNPSGAQRLITFDTSTNIGLYSFPPSVPIPNGVVHYYTGTPPVANANKEILANTYFLYTIVRVGSADSVYFYINGAKSDSVYDPAGVLSPQTSTYPIWFLIDNGTTGGGSSTCETGPGSMKYLSIKDDVSSAAQIQNFYTNMCATVLPLHLLNFQATKQNASVDLTWTTTSEVNTSHFELERASDGVNFNRLATISTHNNSSINNYSFVDQQPLSTNYYRLKMVDIDGKFTYSGILKINFSGTQNFEVFPNPARSTITITGINSNGQIKLLSADGKLLVQKRATGQTMSMDISSYSAGLYILQYFDGTTVRSQKIMKE